MSVIKISAKGVIAKFGTAATPTTTVDGMDTISLNIGDRELVETTAHDSDTTREYSDAGLRDTNEITIVMFFDPANAVHEAIRAAHAGGKAANAGVNYFLTLIIPTATAKQWAGEGLVTKFSFLNLGTKDPLKASATFKAIKKETYS